ncbi:MAG: coenzyme A pyrophosphatase, partial [Pseudonocardiales bacterium]
MSELPEPDLSALPDWLRPLASAAHRLRPADLSRFLPPDDGSGRASAVLMALTMTPDGPGILLIERAADMRTHAGQVAFPGGAADPDDPHRVATALREAEEEVGLDPASVHVVAELPAIYLPPSGFVVTPVLAWWSEPHPVTAVDPAEVAAVAVVPIAELTDPANRFRVLHPSGWQGPGFAAGGLFIWGFTAGLLDR